MSHQPTPEAEKLVDALAGMKLAHEKVVRSVTADLPVPGILALITDVKAVFADEEEMPDYVQEALNLWRAEIGKRHAVARARELGGDAYCVAHDCLPKDCPEGAHD